MNNIDLYPGEKIKLFVEFIKECGLYHLVMSKSGPDIINLLLSTSLRWKEWGCFLPAQVKQVFYFKYNQSISQCWQGYCDLMENK